jgi:hypothetical protein
LPLGQGHKAAAAGIEPASGRLTAAYPYQHGSHRKISRRGWSRTSIFVLPKHADFPSLPHAEEMSAQRELNPLFRPGKAAGCRYIMGACVTTKLSTSESTGPDSNRRHRITGAESWPLDDQCLLSVGPEGLEPSPARLRAGNAAANTLILCFMLARWELNPRPASYKDAALTAELRASSWVGGIRTHTSLIKSQVCSRYTTT